MYEVMWKERGLIPGGEVRDRPHPVAIFFILRDVKKADDKYFANLYRTNREARASVHRLRGENPLYTAAVHTS